MSSSEDRKSILSFLYGILKTMQQKKGSDLFLIAGFPPAYKIDGEVQKFSEDSLTPKNTYDIAAVLMNDKVRAEFEKEKEVNFAVTPGDFGRFRTNVFLQQGSIGLVLRVINTIVPSVEELGVPDIAKEIIMSKRGLVLVSGATGSGKSNTLAAMVKYRSEEASNHIIIVEDPIEFIHVNNKSVISHREVGIDTNSWESALKNAMRQAPDVIMIGEIRDRETMETALSFSETGHLFLSTVHANNANQTIDRILNFFPEEKRSQVLIDLSLNIRAIISQRLIRTLSGKGRALAVEILLNSPLVSDLIFKGELLGIKEAMKKSQSIGMQTFDQSLFHLFENDLISYEDALRNADSINDLRLNIKLNSKRALEEVKKQTKLIGII